MIPFESPAIIAPYLRVAEQHGLMAELVQALRFGHFESEQDAVLYVLERFRDELRAPEFVGPTRQARRQSRKAEKRARAVYDAALADLREQAGRAA